jgi:hypothetical protein
MIGVSIVYMGVVLINGSGLGNIQVLLFYIYNMRYIMTFNESKKFPDIREYDIDGYKIRIGMDVKSSNHLLNVLGDDDDISLSIDGERGHIALIRILENIPTQELLKKVAWKLIKLYGVELPCKVVWSKVKFVGDINNSNEIKIDLKINENNSETKTPISFIDKGYDPSDIRYTFLSLVQETYPHGYEEQVATLLPDVETDEFGNYYKVIGNSKTMFASHLDTQSEQKYEISLFSSELNGSEIISTDGNTILGADDKAGVALMIYMMYHQVPGIYYFFIGEERGGVGSGEVSKSFDNITHLSGVERCISFDRRDNHSVITHQKEQECCSDEFASELCDMFNSHGLDMEKDPTGVSSDSAYLMGNIPECTNISVGYMNEHTGDEYQDITFLKKLSDACVKIDWESLPLFRQTEINE